MFKQIKKYCALALATVFVFSPLRFSGFHPSKSQVLGITLEVISSDTVWGPGEHIVDKWIHIENGATLTIQKGATVKFVGGSDHTDIPIITVSSGNIVAEGTPEERITFTTATDEDEYGISIREDGSDKTSVFSYVDFENGGYLAYPTTFNTKQYLQSVYAYGYPYPTISYSGGNVRIEHSAFKNSRYEDVEINMDISEESDNEYFNIADSNFEKGQSNNVAVESYIYCYSDECDMKNEHVRLANNWYADSAGPAVEPDFIGDGKRIIGDYTLECWRTASVFDSSSSVTCPSSISNVLFLPGIEASRLYMNDGSGEDKLWEPNYFGNDIEDLAMDEYGESANSVYTKEVIDEVGDIWVGGNIYKSFENKLKELKDSGTINGYDMFAYDWRKNVEDVATKDTAYFPGIMKNALSTAKSLADSSKSKKVTIVAHSNGGLVAKAIMQELEKEGNADKVDKIVFVASPQIGTPVAVLSMLYGYDQSLLWGTLMNKSEARTFAENMPGAYGLLPSKTYFDRMQEPFIEFSSENTRYLQFKEKYGSEINDWDELEDFLTARLDNREKPDGDETEFENVLNSRLLQQAEEIHQRLDNWTIPSNVEVIEIAGWGLDTVSGVEYREKKKTECKSYNAKIPSCAKNDEYEPYYEPRWTIDGDEVVVASSAHMLPETDSVKRYWVDLWSYNDLLTMKRGHKDILEVSDVNEFITNILTNNNLDVLPEYIKTFRPDDYENAKPRLRMSLYSPLDIHLYANGKHTGPIIVEESGQQIKALEQEIPNSYYYQFGERKYVGVPSGGNIHMEMDGYGAGSYTLKLEELKEETGGEQVITQKIFSDLPVSSETKIVLDIPEAGLTNLPNLKADYDGDGIDDYEVAINSDGETQIIDNVKPIIEITSPEEREYLNSQIIDFSYDIEDNLSERNDMVVRTYLDDQQISNDKIDFAMLNLGNHKIKITATDKASNTQEKEVIFSITTSLQAIRDNVQKYCDSKLIKSKQQKNMLLLSLEIIEQRLEFLEMIRKNPHISKKAKSIIEGIVREQIENHIEFMINQINHNKNKYDAKIRVLLIEDLQWLELNLVK